MATYAITGANGFLGKGLVSHLTKNGHKVIAIVRDKRKANIGSLSAVEVRQADVRKPEELLKALKGTDGVFHLAALFNRSECTWQDYRDVNVTGTINVVAAAKACGLERVIHCSTVGVATQAHTPPYDEDTPYSPLPGDRYEVSKAEGEKAAIASAREHGISLTVIRPTQIYGPGDRSKAKFYRLIRKGWIVDPGDTMKHPIYIDDLCRGLYLAMREPAADGEIILIGNPAPVRLDKMIRLAANILQVKNPNRLPAKPVLLVCALADKASRTFGIRLPVHRRSMDFFTRSISVTTTKAHDLLGFVADTPLKQGIESTVKWYESKGLI